MIWAGLKKWAPTIRSNAFVWPPTSLMSMVDVLDDRMQSLRHAFSRSLKICRVHSTNIKSRSLKLLKVIEPTSDVVLSSYAGMINSKQCSPCSSPSPDPSRSAEQTTSTFNSVLFWRAGIIPEGILHWSVQQTFSRFQKKCKLHSTKIQVPGPQDVLARAVNGTNSSPVSQPYAECTAD